MNKIVFSIPVHEKPEVIFDQIFNLKYFNPGCAVVLHISPVFSWDKSEIKQPQFEEIIKNIPDVYINSEQVRTGWLDIIQAHLSNYKFMRSKIDFEYFVLTASNELYIKNGAYELISNYEAGFSTGRIINFNSVSSFAYRAETDKALINIIKEITNYKNEKEITQNIYSSQVEGSFFSVKVFDEIFALTEKYFDYKNVKYLYQREEIYFGTIVKLTVPEEKIYTKNLTYTTNDLSYFYNFDFILNNYFSVKRVDREINNPIRAYIRDVLGGYHGDVQKICLSELKAFDRKDLEIYERHEKNNSKENFTRKIKTLIRRIKPVRFFIDRNKFIIAENNCV